MEDDATDQILVMFVYFTTVPCVELKSFLYPNGHIFGTLEAHKQQPLQGQFYEIFHTFDQKISAWAPYEQAKMV